MARRQQPALRIGARVRLLTVSYLPQRLALRSDTGQIVDRCPEPDVWLVRLDQPATWIWPDGTCRTAPGRGTLPEDQLSLVYERADCLEILLP